MPDTFTVDLNGWDAVHALSFATLNAQVLASAAAIPTAPFDFDDGAVQLQNAVWDHWRIVEGSSGELLTMQLVFASGTIVRGALSRALANEWIRVQIKLTFLAEHQDPANGSQQSLVLDAHPPFSEPPVVFVDTSLAQYPAWNTAVNLAAVGDCFADYFDDRLDQFTQAFHLALVGGKAADPRFQWLRPQRVSYAVAEPAGAFDENQAVFAILVQLAGNDAQPAQVVDVRILEHMPPGCDALFALSQERLTERMLLPAAATILQTKPEDLEIVGDGHSVTNKNALDWVNVDTGKGVVTPHLDPGSFQLTVEADHLTIRFRPMTFRAPHYHFPGHLTVGVSWEQFLFLKADIGADGELRLLPTPTDPYDPSSSVAEANPVFTVTPSQGVRTFQIAMVGLTIGLTVIGFGVAAIARATSSVTGAAEGAAAGGETAEGAAAGAEMTVMAADLAAPAGGAGAAAEEAGAVASQYQTFSRLAEAAHIYDSAGSPFITGAEAVSGAGEAAAGGGEAAAGGASAGAGGAGAAAGGAESGAATVPANLVRAYNKVLVGTAVLGFLGGVATGSAWIKALVEEKASKPTGIPTLGAFAGNLLQASRWPGNEHMSIQTARLAGALLVYGRLEPSAGA